jgi:uncharacterized membrane protein
MSFLDLPLHPMFVHFPIALYLLGVLMSIACLWQGRLDFDRFAYWSFVLALLAAIVASLVGLVDQNRLDYLDTRRAAVNDHITTAISLLVVNGLLVYLRFRWPDVLQQPRRRWQYMVLMLAGLALLVVTGWQGGDLVYRLQVGIE